MNRAKLDRPVFVLLPCALGAVYCRKTHKPERVSGRADLTKMFHVKHFCPIGAENLTRPKTAASLFTS
jgi:hypothetical protein